MDKRMAVCAALALTSCTSVPTAPAMEPAALETMQEVVRSLASDEFRLLRDESCAADAGGC